MIRSLFLDRKKMVWGLGRVPQEPLRGEGFLFLLIVFLCHDGKLNNCSTGLLGALFIQLERDDG